VLIKEITPELLVRWSQNEEHLRALRLLAPKSMLMMPLAAHGRVVGAMSLVSTRPQHVYTRADIGFAEQIAQRAAHALNSAQLYARAKRAIHARDTVLGIVAHDLRNPLTTILMQAALLHRAGSQPERRSRQPAETIERACRRMSRIIQDLLDVARIEEGQLSIERERVSPRQSIVEAIDAYAAAATVGGIELQLECAHELPQVWADRYRLLQILENLVSNALKFTPPGGTVRIGAARSSAEVLFSVADTGSGISPENLRHIFDRFWRLRKSDRTGLGLGLPIVKGLVEAHGGHVWAESAVDQGTTFFFTMPLAPRAQDRAATGPSV
jgi:signal transduction histidine kinase